MTYDIAVIGAGASGMICALSAYIAAKNNNKKISVAIIDKNPQPCLKLAVTGNGRCNLLPVEFDRNKFFGDPVFTGLLVDERYSLSSVKNFFSDILGLSMRREDDRLYPASNRADSVTALLTSLVSGSGASYYFGHNVDAVRKINGLYNIDDLLTSKTIVFACGGLSYPQKGSDGSIVPVLKGIGVSFTDQFPSLSALKAERIPKYLDGIRAFGKVTVITPDGQTAQESGEIQFGKDHLSGVVIMDVSRIVSDYLCNTNQKKTVKLSIDLAPGHNEIDIMTNYTNLKKYNGVTLKTFLSSYVPAKLAISVSLDSGISPDTFISDCSENEMRNVIRTLKIFSFNITGVKGYDYAQITAGGVAGRNIERPGSLMLSSLPGAFVCGELCDVDASCGGNNLLWAWASGIAAGEQAYSYLTNNQ